MVVNLYTLVCCAPGPNGDRQVKSLEDIETDSDSGEDDAESVER